MKVTVLMENVTPSARFAARHGLSLFLESQGARILFDVGPDEFFWKTPSRWALMCAQLTRS